MSPFEERKSSNLDRVKAFIVEGLANAHVSAANVKSAQIADRPVRWKLGTQGRGVSSWDDDLLANYMSPEGGGVVGSGDGLRLVAPLGWQGRGAIDGIVNLPGYQAAADINTGGAFKSFTIDPTRPYGLPGYFGRRDTPAFPWPIPVSASDDLAHALEKSHAAMRGFVVLSPAVDINSPSVSADIVDLSGEGLTGSFLALRFLRAGATSSRLASELSLSGVSRNEPLVLLPLQGRSPEFVLTDFVYELAHNLPIDVAAWKAVRQINSDKPPVVIAPLDFLGKAQLSDIIPGLQARLGHLSPDSMIDVAGSDLLKFNPLAFQDLDMSRPTVGLVQDILSRRSDFAWNFERDSAESLLVVERAVAALEQNLKRSSRPSSPAGLGQRLGTLVGSILPAPTLGGGANLEIKDIIGGLRDALNSADKAPPAPSPDQPARPIEAVPPSPPERYTNVRMFDGTRELNHETVLIATRTYTLDVSVGTKRSGLTEKDETLPLRLVGQTGPANVWVVVTDETDRDGDSDRAGALVFDKRYGVFVLPVEGDSEGSARFNITPNPKLFESGGRGQIGIRLYHKLNLIDHVELDIYVAASAQGRPKDGRPAIGVAFKRPPSDGGIEPPAEQAAARALTISISRKAGTDLYRFAFVKAKDDSGEPQLIADKILSAEALNDFVARFRTILLETVFGASLLRADLSRDDRDIALRKLSVLGTDIITRLFDYETGEGDVFALGQMVGEALPETAIIQIALSQGAEDFVFPWQVLTLKPYADLNLVPEESNLWGFRFIIEVKRIRDGANAGPRVAPMRSPARVHYGKWAFINEPPHYEFLRGAVAKTAGKVELDPTVIDSRATLIDTLARGGGELLYVYAHGQAAAPSTPEGHAFNNRIRQQIIDIDKDLKLKALSPEQAKVWTETYNLVLKVANDTAISTLYLTNSEVLLTGVLIAQDANQAMIRLRDAPIVLLNTCQSAQLWNAVEGSFVGFFLKRGARAVLGTESTIPIVFADLFGRAVLSEIFDGKSLGEAVKVARETLLAKQNNPLGLCYSIYGAADAALFPSRQP